MTILLASVAILLLVVLFAWLRERRLHRKPRLLGKILDLADALEHELLECRARLRDSVRAHLLSDVPVGVMLSGGVDSAALAALAAQESTDAIHTFTIGFAERSFDERADARLVAERYGTNHHELLVRPDPTVLLPALAEAFDEPFADSSALPTYLVSQLAAEHVKVALSGEGGDELFGGYYTYAADQLADRLAPFARLVRPLVERLPTSTSKASLDYKAKRFVQAAHLPPLERHHGWKEIFSPDARAELTGRSAPFDPVDVYRRRYRETEGADELARLQDIDFGIYLVDDLLVKTDRASMAHSLEPFARETLSAETLRRQGFFHSEAVSRLIGEHVAGVHDRSRQLWGLLSFTLWYERHVEQEPPHLHSARMDALVA